MRLSLRDHVRDMPVADALEFVLEAYEQLAGQHDPFAEEVASFGLSPTMAIMFGVLRARLGSVCSRAVMLSVCDAARPDSMCESNLRTQMHHLRRRVASRYRVVSVWGQGYRMMPVAPSEP